ncbi:MAG: glycoside hydrolase family 43 protein [Myxococcales bacterium]|nr:glycoside hydrolase family 43 protein [Myxococcales bacterium]
MSSDKRDLNLTQQIAQSISQPLVEHIYTADPSAHVFNHRIYIYPSHDIDAGIPFNDNGDHFGMLDYHVFSMASPTAKVVDHGVALDIKDVPWAERQMWAPDVAQKDNHYYFYFPARAYDGLFHIGVAVGDRPEGPFTPEPEPILGSYSIDPAAFADDDGQYYLYWGGLWGGQLQYYPANTYDPASGLRNDNAPAFGPRVAKLDHDMLQFCEDPREIVITSEEGSPLLAGDNDRRYFEGPWVHKYKGTYYLSYSTGDTHFICYATSSNPYGPFQYRGRILLPVIGWTTHHSICKFQEKWYLFYHDASLSDGVTHLRCMKMTELKYLDDGRIITIDPYSGNPR